MARIKSTQLLPKDYEILRDIYEYYFLDFNTARHRYLEQYSKDAIARSSFNRRMSKMVADDVLAAVPFYSDRRKVLRGSTNYAYTLGKRGVQALSDFFEKEIEWDLNRKERKNIYIMHHLNVLFFVYLYKNWISDGTIIDYFGETSSRYQRPNPSNVLKDFIKPDALVLFKRDKSMTPWLIEYERDSRASRDTIMLKLGNYAKYAQHAYYKEHPILAEHDATELPILLLYCENQKVGSRRAELMGQSQLRYFDVENGNGFGDVLIAFQDTVEKNPYGAVYIRLQGEKITMDVANQVQQLLQAFRLEKRKIIPNYYTSRFSIMLDGFVHGEHAGGYLRYFPEEATPARIDQEISTISKSISEKEWERHPLHKKVPCTQFLFVAETLEQEEHIRRRMAQVYAETKTEMYVTRRELVVRQPSGAHWLSHAAADARVRIKL